MEKLLLDLLWQTMFGEDTANALKRANAIRRTPCGNKRHTWPMVKV